jgi:hypothetical protein
MRARLVVCAVLLGAAAALACQTAPLPEPAEPAERADEASPASARAQAFDGARAWQDLEAFAEIGPRVMGSPGAARAREHILSELRDLGLQTELQGLRVERGGETVLRLENVAGVIPGASSDVILLIAPYDTPAFETFEHRGVNQGGSGAAVLLELARALTRDPLPYTVWLVFLEGEAPGAGQQGPSHFGSRGLAQRLVELDAVEHIRLGVVVDRVCDADLEIARDLGSHRIYREEFWRTAGRLDRTEAFPARSDFQSPRSSQEALSDVGVTRVVTLTDTSFGGDEPPGLYAGNADDTIERCSQESLETVGLVTLETLDTLSRRLARIDRFSRSPVGSAGSPRLEQLADEPDPAGVEAPAPAGPGGAPAGEAQLPPQAPGEAQPKQPGEAQP